MPLTTTVGGEEMNVALSDLPTLLAESLYATIVVLLPDPLKIMHGFSIGIRTFSLHKFQALK
jgi:hypothetical protein